MARITAPSEIADLRRSGWILATAMAAVVQAVKPGVTTAALDLIARTQIEAHGARPAFLGYSGYPASLCVSINREVVHGIPSPERVVASGDIVGLDLGVNYRGFFTDHAVTVAAGRPPAKAVQLLADTEAALRAGLAAVRPGGRVGDISAAIQSALEPKGYGIVRQLTGHGVGRAVHEDPAVPNFGRAGTGLKLEPGLVLAIEPMVTLGDWVVSTEPDGWTVVTADGSLAAHFEETVRVTESGYELITTIHGQDSGA